MARPATKQELINIIWEGLYFSSCEHCALMIGDESIEVNSKITGESGNKPFSSEYFLKLDTNWEIIQFRIVSRINDADTAIEGQKHDNHWIINGTPDRRFDACTDIDLTITPFTNTLPINRLTPGVGESVRINVLYINVLDNFILPVEQIYTRISEREYNYKNLHTGLQALMTVDENGLVSDYPGLFTRKA